MKLKTIISLIGTFILFSCSTKVVEPSIPLPTPPQKTESVIPYTKKSDENVQKIISSNDQLKEKAKTQEDTILSQKVKITEALAQAERIREKAKSEILITEIEAIEMQTKIKAIEDENFALIKTNKKLEEDLQWQGDFLAMAKRDAGIALYKTLQQEKELEGLRTNSDILGKMVSKRNSDVEELQKQNSKLTKESASAKVWRNLLWSIIGIFVGWTIVKNILMIYFPATRFRI